MVQSGIVAECYASRRFWSFKVLSVTPPAYLSVDCAQVKLGAVSGQTPN